MMIRASGLVQASPATVARGPPIIIQEKFMLTNYQIMKKLALETLLDECEDCIRNALKNGDWKVAVDILKMADRKK